MPSSTVQVAVRLRPLLSHEAGTSSCVQPLRDQQQQQQQQQAPKKDDDSSSSSSSKEHEIVKSLAIGRGALQKTFTFDQVFPASTPQAILYQQRVSPLVDLCLEGYHATILAYGQTGAGKSHTILGPSNEESNTFDAEHEHAGVIPRAVAQLFDRIRKQDNENKTIQVSIQFLELYGEEIRDLLVATPGEKKLNIRDSADPEVVGATWQTVATSEAALEAMALGISRRVVAATKMNATSSRSHCMFTLRVQQSEGAASKMSKFHFVDLAGAERQKRTGATGTRLQEGIDINKGLLVLGNVIAALGNPTKRGVVPYRDSKLTRLLKGSLGGNHQTLMIACVSPSTVNMEESLNCLRYANRAKNIQNQVVQNVDPTTAKLRALQLQVKQLALDSLRLWNGDKLEYFSVPQLEEMAGLRKKQSVKTEPQPLPKKKSSLQAELVKADPKAKKGASSLQAAKKTSSLQAAKKSSSLQQATKKQPTSSLQALAAASSSAQPVSPGGSSQEPSSWPTASTQSSSSSVTSAADNNDGCDNDSNSTSSSSQSQVPRVISAGSSQASTLSVEEENANDDKKEETTTSASAATDDEDAAAHDEQVDNLRRQLEEAQATLVDLQEREETWMLKSSVYLEEINNLQDQVDRQQRQQQNQQTSPTPAAYGLRGWLSSGPQDPNSPDGSSRGTGGGLLSRSFHGGRSWGRSASTDADDPAPRKRPLLRGGRPTTNKSLSSKALPENDEEGVTETDLTPDYEDDPDYLVDFGNYQVRNLDVEHEAPEVPVKNLDLDSSNGVDASERTERRRRHQQQRNQHFQDDLAQLQIRNLDLERERQEQQQPAGGSWFGRLRNNLASEIHADY